MVFTYEVAQCWKGGVASTRCSSYREGIAATRLFAAAGGKKFYVSIFLMCLRNFVARAEIRLRVCVSCNVEGFTNIES